MSTREPDWVGTSERERASWYCFLRAEDVRESLGEYNERRGSWVSVKEATLQTEVNHSQMIVYGLMIAVTIKLLRSRLTLVVKQ